VSDYLSGILFGVAMGFVGGLTVGLVYVVGVVRQLRRKHREMSLLKAAKLLHVQTAETIAIERERIRKIDFGPISPEEAEAHRKLVREMVSKRDERDRKPGPS